MQKTPEVNRDDVLRVIKRDFPAETETIVELLENVSCPLIGKNRLHLAHLKNSGGSIDKLHESLTIPDSRDVVCYAEYPAHTKLRSSKLNQMSQDQIQAVCAKDWDQYRTWLDAER